MKKIVSMILIFLIIFSITGCSPKKEDDNTLSIEKVIELSQKGDNLSWKDFEKYKSKEVGFGLYILEYEIDDKYYLIIGGRDSKEAPMYIRLVRNENKDDYIDIREENVENFIKLGSSSDVIKTYEKTDPELREEHISDNRLVTYVKYYELNDGTWRTDKYHYKYRLELEGRMPNAVRDSKFVILSNTKDITFKQAYLAFGVSSSMEDYFEEKESVIVAFQ